MGLQEQLLQILRKSRETELQFIANLTDEDRRSEGTYEEWSARDIVAHANFWENVRAERAVGWIQGGKLEPAPQFERANVGCYTRFSTSTWDEVEAFAGGAHASMVDAVRGMDEEALAGPSEEWEERTMWQSIVESAYSHKLSHYSEYYQNKGRKKEAGELWNEWAGQVSSLDTGPDWQGGVHYNAACSLALAGDPDRALEQLREALSLRPSLKPWSRRDSDLESIHDLREFRDLFAPPHWWEALESDPLAEALADQFMRALSMLRTAIDSFTPQEWVEGETRYLRPAGLALHIVQTADLYAALKPGDQSEDPLTQISWQDRESSNLPAQEGLLQYLDTVERRLASFIAGSELEAVENIFPWTGSSILGRAIYTLRHTQHHLADLTMELQRRGFSTPDWE